MPASIELDVEVPVVELAPLAVVLGRLGREDREAHVAERHDLQRLRALVADLELLAHEATLVTGSGSVAASRPG